MKQTTTTEIARALKTAQANELISDQDTSVIFIDQSIISDRVMRLKKSFPDSTLHAVAIKSNPLAVALKLLVGMGVGLEAASVTEVIMASDAGARNDQIVFDSPAKTKSEIEFLRENYPGIRINADSLEELSRYAKSESKFSLGLRINPEVESKTTKSMNVGGAYSKFGQRLTSANRDAVVESCLHWEDLDCLHFHIGSQHQKLEPVFEAANILVELAESINDRAGYKKVTTIDIGGGFPVNYHNGPSFLIEDYASALAENCPALMDGTYQLITEFGRYVHASAAWVATQVEYVKNVTDNEQIAIVHVGADMFLRECYNPDDWHHRHFVLDPHFGQKTEGHNACVDFAGPLCFGGDFVIRKSNLPRVNIGDWLVVLDSGANTFALWSRHCSRPFPKVILDGQESFEVIKPRETYDSVKRFWE